MLKGKRTLATLSVVVVILALALSAVASTGYGQGVDFQEYKPNRLPSGLVTTWGEFYVLRKKGVAPSFTKHINVNFNAPNSWLAEWKSSGQPTNPCSNLPDSKACSTYTTEHGQQYQLSVNTDPNTGSPIYDVRFIKGGTEIWMTVRDFKKEVSTAEWGKIVDSFQAGHYDGLKTKRGSASGP